MIGRETYQLILSMDTLNDNIRAEAVGWSMEDAFANSYTSYTPASAGEAIRDGWKLLAPPTRDGGLSKELYTWWFTKEKERP